MNLILQAIKALLRKVENGLVQNAASISNLSKRVNKAQTAAYSAQNTAGSAKRTADQKMDASNPTGTGDFSMNRKSEYSAGSFSHTEGLNCAATNQISASASTTVISSSGYAAHAEGFGTVATGAAAHAEGNGTKASARAAHAEGTGTTASGESSHAEGGSTAASGESSHAEGGSTAASGSYSHAEGGSTAASGSYSHAEGYYTTASGSYSHAEGYYTTTSGRSTHVQGEYNKRDDTTNLSGERDRYAHIVGNGTSNTARSNAHTLDWAGVPWFQGRPQFGGTEQDNGSQTVIANGDTEIILASSTTGSAKKFCITVDDSGTLTATEVAE